MNAHDRALIEASRLADSTPTVVPDEPETNVVVLADVRRKKTPRSTAQQPDWWMGDGIDGLV